MKIIGLTGGSGAGKSTAAAILSGLGAGWVDADAVYRGLCDASQPMLDKIAAAFGPVLTKDGALDRPALAAAVFSDPEKLARLSAITFPFVREASEQAFGQLAAQGKQVIVYDAPTLFQTGANALCGLCAAVIAPRQVRIARIISRDKLSPEAAAARVDAQPDDAFYRARCQAILVNDGAPARLEPQVRALYQRALCGGA